MAKLRANVAIAVAMWDRMNPRARQYIQGVSIAIVMSIIILMYGSASVVLVWPATNMVAVQVLLADCLRTRHDGSNEEPDR
jgi:hypothetical protein